MLRSNTKKAVQNIRNYIIRNFDSSNYGIELDSPSFADVAKFIMHCFYEEAVKWDKRRMPYQDRFIEWLQGLPSVIDSCYYYNRSAVDDVGEILEETEAEKAKYTEADAEHLLSCLIFREIYKACDYKVM